jgi:L-Ala-D/L-Glu epimerase
MFAATLHAETFPIAGRFVIARGARTEAKVVRVCLTYQSGGNTISGHAECVPYARYGETVDRVVMALQKAIDPLLKQLNQDGRAQKPNSDGFETPRALIQTLLPKGAARNALDCALWDLEAKITQTPLHVLAGVPAPCSVITAYTLSLESPEKMAQVAADQQRPLLKIKLGGEQHLDLQRLSCVRAAAPQSQLIVDANEGWTLENLPIFLNACEKAQVALIEQPLKQGQDTALAAFQGSVPFCADESLHDASDLKNLAGLYPYINIKLDKTGGLTEALHTLQVAQKMGFKIMVGCMVGTSLAMAPAQLLAFAADFVDLDGPLLLATDRTDAIRYEGSLMHPASAALWGWCQKKRGNNAGTFAL